LSLLPPGGRVGLAARCAPTSCAGACCKSAGLQTRQLHVS
jgi:hypothetical protein